MVINKLIINLKIKNVGTRIVAIVKSIIPSALIVIPTIEPTQIIK